MGGGLFVKQILRKVFFEDWALKLTALVITLTLWLAVTGLSTPTTKRLNVPLNLSVASNVQITNVPQQEVEIEISGDKRRIDQIDRSELSATVDLTEAPVGDRIVQLAADSVYVPLPQGVKLTEVAPSRIVVGLEAVEEKELEVRVETAGTPPAGYEVYATTAIPARIRVRGPVSVMSVLDAVRTEKIDISDHKAPFTESRVPVTAANPKAVVLNTVVDVFVRMGERRAERSFSFPVPGTTKHVSFALYGPRSLLSRVKNDELRVEIYLNEAGQEDARVVLPGDLENLVDVRRVTVR
jgi:hypothetical protein